MSPRKPRNVVAVTPGGDLTMDHILGWYAVSSIPDAGVSAAKLRRAWIAAGFDPKVVPKQRKAVHAFQVACRSVETRRQSTTTNGDTLRTVEVRVDEVLENAAECVYQVTLLVRDEANRVIEHPKGMRIVFTKDEQTITTEPLDRDGYEALVGSHVEESIREHFEANSNKVPGAKVREAVRKTLEGVNSTIIARKMYFIPKGGRGQMEDLREALNDVYKDNEATFYTIPVAHDPGQRALIEAEFTANVRERTNKLLNETRDRDTVRSDKLRNMLDERKEIITLVEKYKDMLDLSLNEADERVDVLNDAIEDLVVRTGSAEVSVG